ncbi:MAG: hypothetical protein HC923_04660 [Myxococcales bacterium]|nr:hypothetical protein [Myxococcales bacterium]
MRSWVGLAMGLAAFVASCGEDSTSGGSGNVLDRLSFPVEINFGNVPIKLEVVESLTIRNESTTPVRLVAVRGPVFESEDYELAVVNTLPFTIGTGTPSNLQFTFRARRPLTPVDAVALLEFEGGDIVEIRIKASTAEAVRVSSTSLDFGEVVVGRFRELELEITNQLVRPVPIYVETVGGRAAPTQVRGVGRFEIDSATNSDGRLSSAAPLGGGQTISVTIRYVPDPGFPGTDQATWRIGACPELDDDCSIEVSFRGEALGAPIGCAEPGSGVPVTSIFFGNLNPPETSERVVRCTARAPVRLSALVTPPSTSGVRVETTLARNPPLELEENDVIDVTFRFDPAQLGVGFDVPEDAVLRLLLRDPATQVEIESVDIALDGGHGRPVLTSEPTSISLATTALGTTREASFRIRNDGPVSFSGRAELNPGPGVPAQVFSSPLDGALVDLAAGAERDVTFLFTPGSEISTREATFVFESTATSDPRNPNISLEVPIVAPAENVPPCNLTYSATNIAFGQSEARTENRAFLVLRNELSALCLVNSVRLSSNSSPEIQLVDPPEELRLPSGGTAVIELAFTPEPATGQPPDPTPPRYSSMRRPKTRTPRSQSPRATRK